MEKMHETKDTRTEAEKMRDEQQANKPGKLENDQAYHKNHGEAPVPDNAPDDRNDRTFRNPAAEGLGTPTQEELKKGHKVHGQEDSSK